MKDQIIETWRISNRANLMLLHAIADEGLGCTLSKRGGRTVALQFAHMHNVRLGWLSAGAKELLEGQAKIEREAEVDKKLLQKRLIESGEAIARWIEMGIDNCGKIKAFKRGVVPMMGYMIAHDAHHRGNIMLTLKLSGHKVSQDAQYGIWEWSGKL